MDNNNSQSRVFKIYISNTELAERFIEYCKKNKQSYSSLMQEALIEFFNSNDKISVSDQHTENDTTQSVEELHNTIHEISLSLAYIRSLLRINNSIYSMLSLLVGDDMYNIILEKLKANQWKKEIVEIIENERNAIKDNTDNE